MLLHRVLTAIPLALGVIWLILFQPTDIFVYLLMLVSVLAGYEWSRLSACENKMLGISYAILITGISLSFIYYFSAYTQWYVFLSVVLWLVISLRIKSIRPKKDLNSISLYKLLVGILVVPAAVLSMWAVHKSDIGPQWLMYGLALIWVADIGAYFSGKRFGKNKLAENISPGKTVEGMIGALILTSIYSLLSAYYFELAYQDIVILLLISLLLTVISVVGDLYESTLKREVGLKDSGNILPGHGGILDRIDSVLAAMPVFSVATHLFIQPVFLN